MNKILIVEDDINISRGLEVIVKEIDENVEILITGYCKEAIEIARKNDIDLFLLDIQLEDCSGYDLAHEIREIDRYKLIPMVFITAIPSKELKAYKNIHCYEYIIKPFSKEKVIDTLSTIIKYSDEKTKVKRINFKQTGYSLLIDENDILYVEARNRSVYAITLNDVIEVHNYRLKSLIEDLSNNFIQCHKSFIVNINHIKKFDKNKNELILEKTDVSIPVGRKFKEEIIREIEWNDQYSDVFTLSMWIS